MANLIVVCGPQAVGKIEAIKGIRVISSYD